MTVLGLLDRVDQTDKEESAMITLTTEPPAAAAVRVDWMWTVSVERVLDDPLDLLSWAG